MHLSAGVLTQKPCIYYTRFWCCQIYFYSSQPSVEEDFVSAVLKFYICRNIFWKAYKWKANVTCWAHICLLAALVLHTSLHTHYTLTKWRHHINGTVYGFLTTNCIRNRGSPLITVHSTWWYRTSGYSIAHSNDTLIYCLLENSLIRWFSFKSDKTIVPKGSTSRYVR